MELHPIMAGTGTADGLDLPWTVVSDAVMGGMSAGQMTRDPTHGRAALRLTGQVSLQNNGGFLQLASDLAPGAGVLNASDWTGLALDLCGNAEAYGIHLRTAGLDRPWQSYRAEAVAGTRWERHLLPFTAFKPYRTALPFDPARLRRIAIVAIGRAFHADVALGGLWLYRG